MGGGRLLAQQQQGRAVCTEAAQHSPPVLHLHPAQLARISLQSRGSCAGVRVLPSVALCGLCWRMRRRFDPMLVVLSVCGSATAVCVTVVWQGWLAPEWIGLVGGSSSGVCDTCMMRTHHALTEAGLLRLFDNVCVSRSCASEHIAHEAGPCAAQGVCCHISSKVGCATLVLSAHRAHAPCCSTAAAISSQQVCQCAVTRTI